MNDLITPMNFLITAAGWWVNEWQAKRIEFRALSFRDIFLSEMGRSE